MKNINITFETVEHEQLSELKGKMSWRDYVLDLAGVKKVAPDQKVVYDNR